MIDFVIQPGLQPVVERHIRESADIAAECFGRIVPRLPVQIRLMDTNEVANVVAATDPSGVMDMRAFVAKQRDDRRQYAVPDTVRTMSFVALPTKVIEGSRKPLRRSKAAPSHRSRNCESPQDYFRR
jgi:hypothetical protein